jgi:hypothetical protein
MGRAGDGIGHAGDGLRRICVAVLCVILALTAVIIPYNNKTDEVYAAQLKPIALSTAEQLALGSSTKLTKIHNQITLKQLNYTDAITSMNVKMKNKQTLRWSPLLSFKLPQALNSTDEIEMVVKPASLSSEILTLKHQLTDERYAIVSSVRQAFFDCYIAQEKANFTEDRLEIAQTELARNQSRLLLGQALKADVDTMQSNVTKYTSDLAEQLRQLELAKTKLTNLIGLNVKNGYRFLNPLKEAAITRDNLTSIINHTLANDHAFFETKATENIALVTLNTNVDLLRRKYGGTLNRVSSYISQARAGADIDTAAFQLAFRDMLTAFNAPWNGYWTIKIIFFKIKFPKDFLQGEVDGVRYVEDEPYALMTACLEYAAAKRDTEAAEKELRTQIQGEYETVVTTKNASDALKTQLDAAEAELTRLTLLNQTGQAEYEDVKTQRDDYEGLQIDYLDALVAYNSQLIAFDRLTCGAVTQYFNGVAFTTTAGGGIDSYPTGDGKIWYSISDEISTLSFVFSLQVPDEFEPMVSDYQLIYSGVELGAKTPVESVFRHLTLDYGDTNSLTVRLWNGDEFVADCEIDASITRGTLDLENTAGETEPEIETTIGSYSVENGITGNVNTTTVTPTFNATLDAASYRLRYGESNLNSDNMIPAGKGVKYLSLLAIDLSEVEVLVYDADGGELCTAYFVTSDGSIRTKDEV